MSTKQDSTTEDFTAKTTDWIAKTTRMEHAHRQPSARALATRSLSAADRLTGEDRREALRQHFDAFPPVLGSACPVRH